MAAQEAANAPDRRIPAVTFRESRLGDVRELARIKVEGMKDDPIMRLVRIISLPLVRVLLFQVICSVCLYSVSIFPIFN